MISSSNPRFYSISNDYSHVRYVLHKGLEISWYFYQKFQKMVLISASVWWLWKVIDSYATASELNLLHVNCVKKSASRKKIAIWKRTRPTKKSGAHGKTKKSLRFSHFRLMIIWFSHLLLWIQSIGAETKLFVFESNEFFIR